MMVDINLMSGYWGGFNDGQGRSRTNLPGTFQLWPKLLPSQITWEVSMMVKVNLGRHSRGGLNDSRGHS
jgi:hypothetical protein